MKLVHDLKHDLKRLRVEYNMGNATAILANRGFHSLLFYRVANVLSRYHVPLLPLLFTRIIQILYAIDIDSKAILEGGQVIVHGVGIVIGQGAVIMSNTTIYHGVTVGRKGQGALIPPDDGYPIIHGNCLLAAGAKVIGPIIIGENSIIGPNCVVMESMPANTIIKLAIIAFSRKTIDSNHFIIHENSHCAG